MEVLHKPMNCEPTADHEFNTRERIAFYEGLLDRSRRHAAFEDYTEVRSQ